MLVGGGMCHHDSVTNGQDAIKIFQRFGTLYFTDHQGVGMTYGGGGGIVTR